MQDPRPRRKIVSAEKRDQSAAEAHAIKGSYKDIKDTLAQKDLVEWLKKCYTNYNDVAKDQNLGHEIRVSYLDQAAAFDKVVQYIERMAS